MKQTKHVTWIILIFGLFSVEGHAQTNGTSPDGFTNTVEGQVNATNYQRAKEPAIIDWEKVNKENEERLRNPHPSDWPFPNYQTGPGRPLPIHVNFYCINDHFPTYLLCEYDINEQNYSETNEPTWFKAALKQVRLSGLKKFPPLKWIAVIIINRAGWNGAGTFELAHKVGAIFKADDVFNSTRDLSQLVADAKMDRHPFKYDTQQPTPGEQQRWLIVEQHAATNRPAVSPN
jgi:hypothetical protein